MTQPDDGAITTPDDEILDDEIPDQTDPPEPEPERPNQPARPDRPVLVELAAAILIVGGITALVGLPLTVVLVGLATGERMELFSSLATIVFLVMNAVAIPIGVLIRRGRRWRLCTNVVAISILLYLTEISRPIAVFYFAMAVIVLYALIHHRAWFDRKATTDAAVP
jgi:hypothetical protein